jgi:hypothetical protein
MSTTLKVFRAYLQSTCEKPADLRPLAQSFELSDYEVEQVVLRLEETECPKEARG